MSTKREVHCFAYLITPLQMHEVVTTNTSKAHKLRFQGVQSFRMPVHTVRGWELVADAIYCGCLLVTSASIHLVLVQTLRT